MGRGPALAAVLLGLAALVGCQELVQPAADAMYDYVRQNASEYIDDWGSLRTGIQGMAGQLVQRLKSGTPPAPDEGEILRLATEFESKRNDRWPLPDGESPMTVSPDPADIPADLPPAPGR